MTFIGYSWAFSAAVSNGVIDTMRKVSDGAEAVAFFFFSFQRSAAQRARISGHLSPRSAADLLLRLLFFCLFV